MQVHTLFQHHSLVDSGAEATPPMNVCGISGVITAPSISLMLWLYHWRPGGWDVHCSHTAFLEAPAVNLRVVRCQVVRCGRGRQELVYRDCPCALVRGEGAGRFGS
jgi:hypothetical protein